MIKQFVRTSLLSCASIAVLAGCGITESMTESASATGTQAKGVPKNIIMVVADGMGPAYTTAYRNYVDDPSTPNIESVVFDDILVGNASTYPAQVSGYVTDSAAAATALALNAMTEIFWRSLLMLATNMPIHITVWLQCLREAMFSVCLLQ